MINLPTWIHIDAGRSIVCDRCGDEALLPVADTSIADAFQREHRHDAPLVSAATLRREGEAFRAMVDGEAIGKQLYHAWEIAGDARRNKSGRDVVHVVHSVWRDPSPAPIGGALVTFALARRMFAGEFDRVARNVFEWRGRRHVLHMTDAEAWGVRLARRTGPAGYWRMLLSRLRAAGTLDVDAWGRVCWVDHTGGGRTLQPFACPDEQTFFRLARTRWTAPCGRYDPHGTRWPRGMLPAWYPPEVPYRPARAAAHLYTLPNPRPPRRTEQLHSAAAAGNSTTEVRS